jgi:hypothetical protein
LISAWPAGRLATSQPQIRMSAFCPRAALQDAMSPDLAARRAALTCVAPSVNSLASPWLMKWTAEMSL